MVCPQRIELQFYDGSSIKMRSFIHSFNKYVWGRFLPCAALGKEQRSIGHHPCPQLVVIPGEAEEETHA